MHCDRIPSREASPLSRLLRAPGALTAAKSGDGPALLSDPFVASLRQALDLAARWRNASPSRMIMALMTAAVEEGPLAGLRGVVRHFRRARHPLIWAREVGREVAGATLVAHTNVRDHMYA